MKKPFGFCVGIILCFLFLSLWRIPFSRVLHFVDLAFERDREEGTLNAHGDLIFAYWLLFSYVMGLAVSLGLVWALIRTWAVFLWIPLLLSIAIVYEIGHLHPERVIVFVPAIFPPHLVVVYFFLGLPGVLALLPDPKKCLAKTMS
jgi:hypothetical protein